jgi:three-Cys-motif partner protein
MGTVDHRFGGKWTEIKLSRLGEYLKQYTIALSGKRGSRLEKWYVDAFAGTGDAVVKSSEQADIEFFGQDIDEIAAEAEREIKGSARLALETEPPFDRFLFIEKARARCEELQRLRQEYPDRASSIDIQRADANEYLAQWCQDMPPRRRAVVFLDPYGLEVEWRLIERIAETQKIDLWILFPISAVIRNMPRGKEIPESWQNRLTRLFGARDWMEEFYPAGDDFFSEDPAFKVRERTATFERIEEYFLRRLSEIFVAVVDKPLMLCNSSGSPLFLLCFAAGNPIGAPIARRIAKHILEKEADGS